MTPRLVAESARLAGHPLLRCQTDRRLVDLVRAGNDRAFEAIVDRYRQSLLRYCGRLLPPARAEDAVQQAFLNAYGAMTGGDADLDLRPWLYRIARNACLNALRENGWTHQQIDDLRRGTESAQDVFERRAELREVIEAVHTLPERQRDAMVLRELEGRSYDEIAAALDASDGAVRQLLNRARNTLRAGVTAMTPIGLVARLATPRSHRVVAQISEAAGNDGLRMTATRAAGIAAASLLLLGGASQVPRLPVVGAEPRPSLPAPAAIPTFSVGATGGAAPVAGGLVAAGPAIPPTVPPGTIQVQPSVSDTQDLASGRGRRAHSRADTSPYAVPASPALTADRGDGAQPRRTRVGALVRAVVGRTLQALGGPIRDRVPELHADEGEQREPPVTRVVARTQKANVTVRERAKETVTSVASAPSPEPVHDPAAADGSDEQAGARPSSPEEPASQDGDVETTEAELPASGTERAPVDDPAPPIPEDSAADATLPTEIAIEAEAGSEEDEQESEPDDEQEEDEDDEDSDEDDEDDEDDLPLDLGRDER